MFHILRLRPALPVLLLLGLAVGCAGTGVPVLECRGDALDVTDDFAGGAMGTCEYDGNKRITLRLLPEDEPINKSPWYAFRVRSASDRELTVVLDYGDYQHRYVPKLSDDGEQWRVLPEAQVRQRKKQRHAQFKLPLSAGEDLWVSAQPLLTSDHYAAWVTRQTELGRYRSSVIGASMEERPLHRLVSTARAETLLIIGRQHPPETTGAVAMMAFLDRVQADDALAKRFRDRVGLLVYPLVNPDGVDRGHWRHNVGGKDLNRDWGPFEQIETRTINADIEAFLEAGDTQLIGMLDFHSTWYEVFYTQEDGHARLRGRFNGAWLGRFEELMREKHPGFELNRQSSHNPDLPTTKTYFFMAYGVNATTFEIGDATPLDYIAEYGRLAAEAFMAQWLEGEQDAL